jgi:hypothetical protein
MAVSARRSTRKPRRFKTCLMARPQGQDAVAISRTAPSSRGGFHNPLLAGPSITGDAIAAVAFPHLPIANRGYPSAGVILLTGATYGLAGAFAQPVSAAS